MTHKQVMEPVRRRINKPIKYYSLRDVLKETNYPDKKLYKQVIEEVFKQAKEILFTKRKLKLKNIGIFVIRHFNSNKRLIDYGNSKKLGKEVYYTNFHTQRLVYKINCKFYFYKSTHKFVPYRHLKRDLAKRIFTDATF